MDWLRTKKRVRVRKSAMRTADNETSRMKRLSEWQRFTLTWEVMKAISLVENTLLKGRDFTNPSTQEHQLVIFLCRFYIAAKKFEKAKVHIGNLKNIEEKYLKDAFSVTSNSTRLNLIKGLKSRDFLASMNATKSLSESQIRLKGIALGSIQKIKK